MKTISLTVPMDYNALTRASDMLHGLALDLNREEGKVADEVPTKATPAQGEITPNATPALRHSNGQPDYTEAEQQFAESVAESGLGPSTTAVDDQRTPEPDAASVFGDPKPETAPTIATVPAGPGETSTDDTTDNAQAGQPSESTDTPPGVDLAPSVNTGALIPWDHRIHSSSKAKLAKSPHGWKMKRGVPDELVDRVEAELIAAMRASPANPVESTPAPPASEPTPAPPAQPAAPTGAVTTFPALMSAITSNRIDPVTVTAAVNKAGLQSLPLLAARPDLIPTVAAELGFGG